MKNDLTKLGWLQTDGSLGTMQYGRPLKDRVWEYREVDKQYSTDEEAIADFENWHCDVIDLQYYGLDEIKSAIGHYGYNLNEGSVELILEQSGVTFSVEDSTQLICECIFELEH
jgi:hypothetical protein|tara:strand:+ start:3904 stop:4245 length:342 start_codon:yes stop_codon:yes gene_type:complete